MRSWNAVVPQIRYWYCQLLRCIELHLVMVGLQPNMNVLCLDGRTQDLQEDMNARSVLIDTAFLEKLARPDSNNTLMIAYMPQRDRPVGIASLRSELKAQLDGDNKQAIENIKQQSARMARTVASNMTPDPQQREHVRSLIQQRISVQDLWPTLFVSLLMQE